ncbi:hypothetical protein TVAG_140970 [Trichomonas vaginalis G3]|uniref:Choline transporter-like protein n=1 Tax=Trichomonas vaginalis (strain ATCC PRA-98 / G3) TaxID=412133 RepID=A2FES1_TRIV3|nr:choline transmembrane transporter protein [Trichomonas vaginalis G3]EAX96608.1 hypothetical protein TVAG_140970 [Trichomonas vaginalis G3]KAI5524107.1 choline transmembrane transporter protein [Trichomonas vaginalis G3]|eukprot:XP_001309538.1 hypothetical protein [Trichomonas vaginalis G3]
MSEVRVRYGADEGITYGGGGGSSSVQHQDLTSSKPNDEYDDDLNTPYSYDPNFNGPEEDRHCTDCFCLILFFVAIAAMLGLFFYAVSISKVNYLYTPTDYRGFLCGYDNTKLNKSLNNSNGYSLDYTDKKYLFWSKPGTKAPDGNVVSECVKECPTEGIFNYSVFHNYWNKHLEENETCYKIDNVTIRATILDPYAVGNKKYVCPYRTTPFLLRCTSTEAIEKADFSNNSKLWDDIEKFINGIGSVGNAYSDIKKTWKHVLCFAVIALLLSVIWILTLRCSAAVFVWIAIIGCFVGLGFFTWAAYYVSGINPNNKSENTDTKYNFAFNNKTNNQKAFTIIFYVLIVVDIIILLLFIFLCRRIKLTIGIIKFVSTVFGEVPMLFLFPLIFFLIMLCWWALCIGIAYVLYGAGTLTYDESKKTDYVTMGWLDMKYSDAIKYGSIYHFFMFLWGTAFVTALMEMSFAGVFSKYYFTREPRDENVGHWVCAKSLGRALKYHMGSLAFGSLLIAICQFIRACLEYIDRKTKAAQQESCFIKFIIKCMKCCMWCFEKFLRYINRNAYVLIAIHGYNFWQGACKAFGLILRNPVRATTVNFVGDFMLFLGRVFVAAICAGCSLLWFKRINNLYYYYIPAIFVFILSYIVSGTFTSLFEMGIDSCFMCVLEDEERNKGSQRFAPPDLLEAMEKPEEE